jgi:hypothetical protein
VSLAITLLPIAVTADDRQPRTWEFAEGVRPTVQGSFTLDVEHRAARVKLIDQA